MTDEQIRESTNDGASAKLIAEVTAELLEESDPHELADFTNRFKALAHPLRFRWSIGFLSHIPDSTSVQVRQLHRRDTSVRLPSRSARSSLRPGQKNKSVGVASVLTLLMYSELQTVFRFLHVFTSRIRSAGMFGAFSLDPNMHDAQTRNTVRAIFDCEATSDGDDASLQGAGYVVE